MLFIIKKKNENSGKLLKIILRLLSNVHVPYIVDDSGGFVM